MIDQILIDQNAQRLIDSIIRRSDTDLAGLYIIEDSFDDVILEKLKSYIEHTNRGQWLVVPMQESKSRRKIDWHADTVIEELHDVFSRATNSINDIFPGPQKYFWGISLWEDPPGYELGWHTDNIDIDVSIQIYLYGNGGNGTLFSHRGVNVIVPNVHNSGYLILQTGDDKIPHCTEKPVPDGVTRYSLYAVWSRFPKHLPDA